MRRRVEPNSNNHEAFEPFKRVTEEHSFDYVKEVAKNEFLPAAAADRPLPRLAMPLTRR